MAAFICMILLTLTALWEMIARASRRLRNSNWHKIIRVILFASIAIGFLFIGQTWGILFCVIFALAACYFLLDLSVTYR